MTPTNWLQTGLCVVLLAMNTAGQENDQPAVAPGTEPGVQPSVEDPVTQRFEKITSRMTQAKSQLGARQTGSATQDLQKQILADLDELLKSPPQPSDPNSGGSGGSSNSNASSSASNQKNPSQPQRGEKSSNPSMSNPQKSGSKAGEEQDRETADDSEERTGERQRGSLPELPRQRLEVDVWGHLPENVREKLLNAYGERMVPEYADLVQRFYRSLAETNAPRNRPPIRESR